MKYCTKCGAELSSAQKFCKKCGSPINAVNNNKNKKEDAPAPKADPSTVNIHAEEPKHQAVQAAPTKQPTPQNAIKEKAPKVKKPLSTKRKIALYSAGIIATAIIVVLGVFHKVILSEYYVMKCNNSLNPQEKILYASKAVENKASDKSKALVKQVFTNVDDANVAIVQQKLDELSQVLSSNDYKDISSCLEEKKLNSLCKEDNYTDALAVLNNIYKLGADFKSNKNYDKIMLNTVAQLTGNNVESNKNLLLDNGYAYYDNLDNDIFDEIVHVKSSSSFLSSDTEIQLFKYKDGKYELAHKQIIPGAYTSTILDVQNYATNKKGVFIKYEKENEYYITVCDVKDGQLGLKGSISGKESVNVQDVDNDKIYEGYSSSISTATLKTITKWYKFNPDGSDPKEVKGEVKDSNSSSSSSSSSTGSIDTNFSDNYIFANVDTEYLTDDDVKYLSKDELALARNEIFAKHGFVFGVEPFKSYFEKKSWYHADPNYTDNDSTLNEYEKANLKLIQKWEGQK